MKKFHLNFKKFLKKPLESSTELKEIKRAEKKVEVKNIETGRLKCIDALRGMAIALMLLGDNPGNPDKIYPQLRHSKWNGCTAIDLAFPFFIIIMGMVVPYTLNKRIAKGERPLKIFIHILVRSVEIFVLGLFLNGFPLYDLSSIRILGVLQRIAICYFMVSSLTLLILYFINNKLIQTAIQLVLAFTIIISYYLLLKNITVPWGGKGILAQEGNLVQYIDLKFLKGHLYIKNWDPEGILSTLPAIASALFGAVTGQILTYPTNKKIYKLLSVLAFGIIIAKIALLTQSSMPFNKNLWSSSFVLLTAGMAAILIAVLYFIMDIIKYDSIFKPFVFLGSSSIFVYLVSEIIRKTLWVIPVVDSVTKKSVTLNVWITNNYIAPWSGNFLDSFYFSVIYVVLWIVIMSGLYNKKNFMKL